MSTDDNSFLKFVVVDELSTVNKDDLGSLHVESLLIIGRKEDELARQSKTS